MTTTIQYSRHHSVALTPSARYRSRPSISPRQLDVKRAKGHDIMSRELPMPKVNRIYSLNQAHATLLLCWNKLSKLTRGSPPPGSATGGPSSAAEGRLECQLSLERWEQAFTDYLSTSVPSMSPEDLSQCRVLKANHLACTILASSPESLGVDFEANFAAITDLASAVLHDRQASGSTENAKANDNERLYSGLDVRDPLYVVTSRCSERRICGRANDLLARYYP